jgi:hypothetical protein
MVNFIAFLVSAIISLAVVILPIKTSEIENVDSIIVTCEVIAIGLVLFFLLRFLLPKIKKLQSAKPSHGILFSIILIIVLLAGSMWALSMKNQKWASDVNNPKNILEKIGKDVCLNGIAHPELSKYNKGGKNPAYFYGSLYSDYHGVEQNWLPEKNVDIQLVICQDEVATTTVKTCHYDYMTRNGEKIPNSATDIEYTFILKHQNIKIISVTDLTQIAGFTLDPDMNTDCPNSLSIGSSDTKTKTETRYVSAADVVQAINNALVK